MPYSREATEKVRRWFEAVRDPEIESEIASIHEEIADAVRDARPHCLASGGCCRFRENRIRLDATGVEAARCLVMTSDSGIGIGHADLERAVGEGGCPWNVDRLCQARAARPSGCRVYFCDPRAKTLVPKLQHMALERLQQLHLQHRLIWAWGEWREMLRGIMLVAEEAGFLPPARNPGES